MHSGDGQAMNAVNVELKVDSGRLTAEFHSRRREVMWRANVRLTFSPLAVVQLFRKLSKKHKTSLFGSLVAQLCA